jgi:hypothetical protein
MRTTRPAEVRNYPKARGRDQKSAVGRLPGATLTSTACHIGKDDARGSLLSLAKLSASVLD